MKTFNEIKPGDTIWTVVWEDHATRVTSYAVKEIITGENCVAFTAKGQILGALMIGKSLIRNGSAHQVELFKSYYADRALMEEDIRNYRERTQSMC